MIMTLLIIYFMLYPDNDLKNSFIDHYRDNIRHMPVISIKMDTVKDGYSLRIMPDDEYLYLIMFHSNPYNNGSVRGYSRNYSLGAHKGITIIKYNIKSKTKTYNIFDDVIVDNYFHKSYLYEDNIYIRTINKGIITIDKNTLEIKDIFDRIIEVDSDELIEVYPLSDKRRYEGTIEFSVLIDRVTKKIYFCYFIFHYDEGKGGSINIKIWNAEDKTLVFQYYLKRDIQFQERRRFLQASISDDKLYYILDNNIFQLNLNNNERTNIGPMRKYQDVFADNKRIYTVYDNKCRDYMSPLELSCIDIEKNEICWSIDIRDRYWNFTQWDNRLIISDLCIDILTGKKIWNIKEIVRQKINALNSPYRESLLYQLQIHGMRSVLFREHYTEGFYNTRLIPIELGFSYEEFFVFPEAHMFFLFDLKQGKVIKILEGEELDDYKHDFYCSYDDIFYRANIDAEKKFINVYRYSPD